MAHDAQKSIFYLEESNEKLETFWLSTYREDNLQGVNGPYLCHNSFKLNEAPDAELDFIMKEDHKKSESFDDFLDISKRLEYQNNFRCFSSALVQSALTLKLQLLAKIISLVLIALSMF